MGWISVKDWLPDKGVSALVYSPDFGYALCRMESVGWWETDDSGWCSGVTHWMPLEPPQGF